MKSKKSQILNLLFLVLIIGLTIYGVFKGQDLGAMLEQLKSANYAWLAVGVCCVVLFIYGESYIIRYLLKLVRIKSKAFTCFLYSCVGFFFSCITPSASGGQPMQIYYMKKNKIPIPTATVLLMIVTITYKFVLVLVGLFLIFFHQSFVETYLKDIKGVFYLGIALNVFCVTSMMVLVFNQKLAKWIIITGYKLLAKMHIVKHKSERLESLENSMETYKETAVFLKGHKSAIVKVTFVTILQRFAMFFATYFTYLALGLHGASIYDIVMLQAVISVSVDMLPLPGGMGISETLFAIIFLPIFGTEHILAGLILSRGLGYYTQLLLSAVLTVVANFRIGKYDIGDGNELNEQGEIVRQNFQSAD